MLPRLEGSLHAWSRDFGPGRARFAALAHVAQRLAARAEVDAQDQALHLFRCLQRAHDQLAGLPPDADRTDAEHRVMDGVEDCARSFESVGPILEILRKRGVVRRELSSWVCPDS